MKKILKLTAIGLFAGLILMLVLKIILILTGNTAYILLFNFDYVPIIKDLEPVWLFGYLFHFLTCIISVVALFFILKYWNIQKRMLPYSIVYTLGGGALFFLTALSHQPPEATDVMAWFYWTVAHAIFGFVVGVSIKKWM
ncbi:hypothetical protein ACFFU9_13945 [Mariniflexile ostreae]|uniref:Uncharacterized protein n=1 Tax=Mariniflexile ostreae TaxID=1520892 RepID=A0ABV5FEF0_9FLAO